MAGELSRRAKEALFGKVEATIDRVLPDILGKALGLDLPDDAPMNEAQFCYAMAQEFARRSRPQIAAQEALALARRALTAMLSDEGIAFGAEGYTWDRAAARITAHEYEIEHWEVEHGG